MAYKLIWNVVQDFANIGVANGGREQVGAYSSGRRPWGRINTLCSHIKSRLKADI